MKTNLFSFILFLVAACSYGQIIYEKGYFIDNDNRRTECLIKNYDWKNSPDEILFMREESGISEKENIASVKEFGIYGYSKYIRANINIDRSSDDIDRLTKEKNPIWFKEQLFLKVIVEGKASLYYYEDDNLRRFFYSVVDTSINQLVYKKYLAVETVDFGDFETGIGYNNWFRQQLWNDVRCANTNWNSMENVDYTLKDLEKYFTNYSKCLGDSIVEYSNNKTKRDFFNIRITPGFNISSVAVSYALNDTRDIAFKSNLGFRVGIESEFILPYNKNKWGVLFEPTFQYFNSEKIHNTERAVINYKSLEFPFGIRHYFFLNDALKIFLNGFYISSTCADFNSEVKIDKYTVLDIVPRGSFAFGGGVENKRLSAEIRYYTNRELFSDYIYWTTNYNRFSFIIGYKLINTSKNKL